MAEPVDTEVVGELLALLAHDLRNPLSALHSNLGFLGSVLEAPDEDTRDAIDDGLVSCDGLSHIIDNIDLFGQTLRSAEQSPIIEFDLRALLEDVASRSQQMARSHGLSLELDEDVKALEVEVAAPRDLLARALANLVRNSVQHAPPGSTVRVGATAESDTVTVLVRDGGAVVATDSVFSAQGQVSSKSLSNARYSRGMGLYCAKLAAELCQANVSIVPGEGGQGNCFSLSIARAKRY